MSGLDWLRQKWGRRARQVGASYINTLGAEGARPMLRDMAEYCRMNATSHVPGDPYATAFNEGARDAYLYMLGQAGLTWRDLETIEVSDDRNGHDNGPGDGFWGDGDPDF